MAGGFFGGLSEGITQAQQDALAKQKQDALERNDAKTTATKQIDATLAQITDIAKAAAAEGKDPRQIADAVQPLIQSAQSLAAKAGFDPAMVGQRATVALMHPGSPADKKHSVVKIGSGTDATGATKDQYGVLEEKTGKVTPLGQPQLAQSDVITPGQAATANPNPAAIAPVPSPVAPAPAAAPAAIPAAPDGTPAQTVAARFPSPTQGGPQAQPATPPKPMLPPTMQPGAEAIDYAIKNNVTGQEFLKAVPPQARNTVSGITDYKVDPDKLSKRVDKSGQSEYTRMLSWAHQVDPDYDPKYYKPMQKAITEFTSGGAQSPASQMTAGNTAIQHIGELADAYDKMQAVPGLLDRIAKSGTSIASYAAAKLKNEAIRGTSEGAALAAFMDARERYSAEIERFYAGGKGADAAIQRNHAALDAAYSPAEMYSALNAESHLLAGKVNTLQERWKTSQAGPKFADVAIRNAIPDFPIIQAKSEQVLDRVAKGFMATKGAQMPAAQGNVIDYQTYFGNK